MKKIAKIDLGTISFPDTFNVVALSGKVVRVHHNGARLILYTEASPPYLEEKREFHVFGNWQEFSEDGLTYVGSGINGSVELHVYEKYIENRKP